MTIKSFELTIESLSALTPDELYGLCLLMYDGTFAYLETLFVDFPKGLRNIAECRDALFQILKQDVVTDLSGEMREPIQNLVDKLKGIKYEFRNPGRLPESGEMKWESDEFKRVGPSVVLRIAEATIKSTMQCLRKIATDNEGPMRGNSEEDDEAIERFFSKFYFPLKMLPSTWGYKVQEHTMFRSIVLKIDQNSESQNT